MLGRIDVEVVHFLVFALRRRAQVAWLAWFFGRFSFLDACEGLQDVAEFLVAEETGGAGGRAGARLGSPLLRVPWSRERGHHAAVAACAGWRLVVGKDGG